MEIYQMFKFFTLIVGAAASQFAYSTEIKTKPQVKKITEEKILQKVIVLNGVKFTLKDEKKSSQSYLAEYLPDGENFDQFNQMFAVWGSKDSTTLSDQVKAKVQFVNSRKSTDPVANFKLFVGDDKKSYGLDFMISEGNIIEHNLWYFTESKKGKIMYQYVRRNYKELSRVPASEFISEVPKVRNEILAEFKKIKLPKPDGY